MFPDDNEFSKGQTCDAPGFANLKKKGKRRLSPTAQSLIYVVILIGVIAAAAVLV